MKEPTLTEIPGLPQRCREAANSYRSIEHHWPADTLLEAADTIELLENMVSELEDQLHTAEDELDAEGGTDGCTDDDPQETPDGRM